MATDRRDSEVQQPRWVEDSPVSVPWPADYQSSPKTLDRSGSAGANYTPKQLEALKTRHGIGYRPAPAKPAAWTIADPTDK